MIGSDVQLECRCEASPTPTTAWIRSDGQLLTSSAKYQMREEHDSYRTKMKLKIVALDEKDFGSYKCVAKNSLGEKEGLVRLYGKSKEFSMLSSFNLILTFLSLEIAPPASTPSGGGSGDQNGHHPTFIYSYQGGRQNGNGNFSDSNFGDQKNSLFDSDYQQASSSNFLYKSPNFAVLLTTIALSILRLIT